MPPVTSGTVLSRDGTSIGYLEMGRGPGLILIQGAMGGTANYRQLAEALAPDFTVYLPDRRGRGMSSRLYSAGHDVERDVEDVEAVRVAVDARFVFGLSSGAMIALEAVRRLSAIEKAAVYEPPFYPEDINRAAIARFKAEVERGYLPSALVTAGTIVGLAPFPVRLLPRVLSRQLTGMVLRRDARRCAAGYLALVELVPAMRYDFDVVAGMQQTMGAFTNLHKDILVLSGTKSPPYLQVAAAKLAGVLPDAQHVSFDGLDHSGPWNADRGGQPDRVAKALRGFFGNRGRLPGEHDPCPKSSLRSDEGAKC